MAKTTQLRLGPRGKIKLDVRFVLKAIVDGIHTATGSDGPQGTPEAKAFLKIRQAPPNDISGILPGDWNKITGLTLQTFVAGDCSQLTDQKKREVWNRIIDRIEAYWVQFPVLANPFPRQKFSIPTMDCSTTTISDLAGTIAAQLLGAQP